MASRILRRSGLAAGVVAERCGWDADWVIQVGVGMYHQETDVLKREKWPDSKFIGYEPNPNIFKNIKQAYPGELFQIAIGKTQGACTLYEKHRHKDGSSCKEFTVDDPNIKISNTYQVEMKTLDAIFCNGPHEIKGNVLLWLDCEGGELDAIEGAIKLIESVEMINIEMTTKPPSDNWPDTRVVHKRLRELGFLRQDVHTLRGSQYDAIYVRPHLFKKEYCICPFSIDEYEMLSEEEINHGK